VHVANRASFIDIGGRSPDGEFTGVIFPESYDALPDVADLECEHVDISGTVQVYRDRPDYPEVSGPTSSRVGVMPITEIRLSLRCCISAATFQTGTCLLRHPYHQSEPHHDRIFSLSTGLPDARNCGALYFAEA
jgi:hypothetical protein